MKKNIYNPILLLILLLFILFIFFYLVKKLKKKNNYDIIYEKFENNNNSKFSYYRCKNKLLGKITKNIFDNNGILESKDNWDIYLPCGYNNVEEELKKILIKDNISNKFIFGINGCDTIVSKNKIWESLLKCFGRNHASTLMPESYILNDYNEMEVFRKNFNPNGSEIYILKKNIQRKEGLKLTKDYFEIINAHNNQYRVAQKYIRDLYLVNGRKVNLRIYLLILIKDNKINFYLCKKGKCIYTNKKYNDNDLDFESNITSYNLDMSVYENSPRHFNELRTYIDENNSSKSRTKNGEYLFNKIDLLIREVSLCIYKNLYQSKNIEGSISFQLFGADVIFTKDLHPYLLEMNKGPDMSPRDKIDELMKNDVQTDMFRTVGILPNNDINSFYLIYRNEMSRKII
jgi:hypothetical protein